MADDVALEGEAVGSTKVRVDEAEERPSSALALADLAELARSGGGIESDLEQVRVARPGPLDRGGDELAEQRVGPVGAALELRVRLRADPERVRSAAR